MGIQRFLFLLVVGMLALMLTVPTANGETVTELEFDKRIYYQGDQVTLSFTLFNENDSSARKIVFVGIQFDWQKLPLKNASQTAFLAKVDKTLGANSAEAFRFTFRLPYNIPVGLHAFEIFYVGEFEGYNAVQHGFINVHHLYEKPSQELRLKALQKIRNTDSTIVVVEFLMSQSGVTGSALGDSQNHLTQAKDLLAKAQYSFDSGDVALRGTAFSEAYNRYEAADAAADSARNFALEAADIVSMAEQQIPEARVQVPALDQANPQLTGNIGIIAVIVAIFAVVSAVVLLRKQ